MTASSVRSQSDVSVALAGSTPRVSVTPTRMAQAGAARASLAPIDAALAEPRPLRSRLRRTDASLRIVCVAPQTLQIAAP